MKNTLNNLLLVIICAMNMSLFAQYGGYPGETTDFILRVNEMYPPVVTGNFNQVKEWLQLGELKQKAIFSGNWSSALSYAREQFRKRPDALLINEADSRLEMSMLQWNNGNLREAKDEMMRCMNCLKSDPRITKVGYERAEYFYGQMKERQLPKCFPSEAFRVERNYLRGFIMEIAQKQFNNALDQSIRQSNMAVKILDQMIKNMK